WLMASWPAEGTETSTASRPGALHAPVLASPGPIIAGWRAAKPPPAHRRMMPLLSLLFGNLVQHRLPHLLLLVDERRHFGGRHRIGIATERRKPLLDLRFDDHFAQIFAELADDGLRRADGRHQNAPAGGAKTWNRFGHGRHVGKLGQ